MKENIRQIVINCCHEHNDISDTKIDIQNGDTAALYGVDGVLDSISLVSLIIAIEQAVESELNVLVTLADAKAASQKASPFRTVGSLIEYTIASVDEEMRANA